MTILTIFSQVEKKRHRFLNSMEERFFILERYEKDVYFSGQIKTRNICPEQHF